MAVQISDLSPACESDESCAPPRSTVAIVCNSPKQSASQLPRLQHRQPYCSHITHAEVYDSPMTRHGSARLAWSFACATLIALAVWFLSRSGALLTPDSLSYVGAAHELAEHGTLRVPIAKWSDADSTTVLQQFTPGYPAVLAVALRVGVPSDTVVRVVNVCAAFALVALLVWLCSAAADDAWRVRVAAPLAILAVRAIPTAWTSAWSEPLFLFALALTLVLMVLRPSKGWMFGITAAFGNSVRYAGVSLLLAAVTWAAFQAYQQPDAAPTERGARRARALRTVRAATLAAMPGVLFNAWWLWRARAYGVSTPIGTVAWMGNLSAAGGEAIQTVSAQLVPLATTIPEWVRIDTALVLLIGIVAVMVASIRRACREVAPAVTPEGLSARTILASLTIAGSYAAMLVYSRLFVGDSIPLDDRLLAPAVLTIGIAALLAIHTQLRVASTGARAVAFAACLGWLVAAASQGYFDVKSLLLDRDDYGSESWTGTASADWLRTRGRVHALYSNDPVATYFITGRPSRTVPTGVGSATAPDLLMRLRATNGVLIEYPEPLENMVDARELARQVGMCMVVASEMGNVWRLPTSATEQCQGGANAAKPDAAPSPSSSTSPAAVRQSP